MLFDYYFINGKACSHAAVVAIKVEVATTGTIYLSQLRDVTKALPGKLPVQIKFRLFPIDCDVSDILF